MKDFDTHEENHGSVSMQEFIKERDHLTHRIWTMEQKVNSHVDWHNKESITKADVQTMYGSLRAVVDEIQKRVTSLEYKSSALKTEAYSKGYGQAPAVVSGSVEIPGMTKTKFQQIFDEAKEKKQDDELTKAIEGCAKQVLDQAEEKYWQSGPDGELVGRMLFVPNKKHGDGSYYLMTKYFEHRSKYQVLCWHTSLPDQVSHDLFTVGKEDQEFLVSNVDYRSNLSKKCAEISFDDAKSQRVCLTYVNPFPRGLEILMAVRTSILGMKEMDKQ